MAMLELRPTVSFLRGSLVLMLGVGCRTASAASALRERSVWHNWEVGISAAVGGVVVGSACPGASPARRWRA
eukprot:scaffold13698_cov57-Phaeocystis_antarctica.AAC.3